MGHWLAVNGDAIYATQPTLFGDEAGAFSATEKDEEGKPKFIPSWKWRSTTKPDRINGRHWDISFWFAVSSPAIGALIGFLALTLFYR